jgi:hypothetical protein|tara:strand:+ start:66 stop:410 length:345 start_codon:yes stop_codon:yes gene_type:complete
MTNLAKKIEIYLGRKPDFLNEVILQDDMIDGVSNPYIKEWNITSEKAKPTNSELNALSTQAETLIKNQNIDAKRRTEYLSWEQQFEMIYKDQKNGTTTYKDHCDKVRSDNPREA